MKTIFSANRKALKNPEFVSVSTKNESPNYSLYYTRKSRDAYAKERDRAAYVINIYPRNWPRLTRTRWENDA